MSAVCEAIRERKLLQFQYHGKVRIVAPYCHGVSARGSELLRAIQVRGASSSGGFGQGKLWTVGNMVDVRVLEEPFAPDDPNYNPNDSAMSEIHCCV